MLRLINHPTNTVGLYMLIQQVFVCFVFKGKERRKMRLVFYTHVVSPEIDLVIQLD